MSTMSPSPTKFTPTPRQKAWVQRLRPQLPAWFPQAQGHLDLRPAAPPEIRTNSHLYTFTILQDGLPLTDILVRVPKGRGAANPQRTYQAYRRLAHFFAPEPHLQVPHALAAWDDPPALIMERVQGDPLYLRLKDCRNWAPDTGCQMAQHFVERAGRWLGLLHTMPIPDHVTPIPDPLARMETLLEQLRPYGMDPVEEAKIRRFIEPLADDTQEIVPLHGDFTLRNILCSPPHHITVLDTELATIGPPGVDIGWFLASLFAIDKWHILGGDMVYTRAVIRQTGQHALRGYRAARELPPADFLRGWTTLRLLDRWWSFVHRERTRNIAGMRTFVIRRINQHFVRAIWAVDGLLSHEFE